MKVKFLGESDALGLINGKEYEVLSIEYGYYRIVDETGEDYLYDSDAFIIIEKSDVPIITDEDDEDDYSVSRKSRKIWNVLVAATTVIALVLNVVLLMKLLKKKD